MQTLAVLSFIAVFVFSTSAAAMPSLPESIGSEHALRLTEQPGTWAPENMYEHVNGEAELLKRYGATELVNAYYENDRGTHLSADILDMGVPVNAYGLFTLYAGCDGEEYTVSGATVLVGDFTFYATYDRYFMRIDLETGEGDDEGKSLVNRFLTEFSRTLPPSEPLPEVLRRLKKLARKPCEVGYHPEHVDYDLEAGPGYTWIGPDGGTYFISFLPSADEARVHASVLRSRGAQTVLVWGNAVTWPKVRTDKTADYLKGVLRKVVKW